MASIPRNGVFELEQRKNFRFPVTLPVDVVSNGQRYAFGRLENLSRDGAAVKVLPFLVIGAAYSFHIRGYGTWKGTVVRKFGVQCHGVRFDITECQKRRLDQIILRLLPGASEQDEIEQLQAKFSDPKIRAF